MKRLNRLLLIAAFVLGTVSSAWAIGSTPASLEGTIKSISENIIIISSKSEDGLKIQDVSLEVNSQTKLDEMASVAELKEGDQVKVDYKEEGDKKVVVQITKQEKKEWFR